MCDDMWFNESVQWSLVSLILFKYIKRELALPKLRYHTFLARPVCCTCKWEQKLQNCFASSFMLTFRSVRDHLFLYIKFCSMSLFASLLQIPFVSTLLLYSSKLLTASTVHVYLLIFLGCLYCLISANLCII